METHFAAHTVPVPYSIPPQSLPPGVLVAERPRTGGSRAPRGRPGSGRRSLLSRTGEAGPGSYRPLEGLWRRREGAETPARSLTQNPAEPHREPPAAIAPVEVAGGASSRCPGPPRSIPSAGGGKRRQEGSSGELVAGQPAGPEGGSTRPSLARLFRQRGGRR